MSDQLTGNGLRMGYLFGKYLREQYATLLPEQLDMSSVYVFASAVDRCKQYAQATMLGVYDFGSLKEPLNVPAERALPPWKGAKVEEGLATPLPHGFQPVPVHSFSAEMNHVFEPHKAQICPLIVDYTTLANSASTKVERLASKFMTELQKEFDYRAVFTQYRSHHQLYQLREYIVAKRYMGVKLLSDETMTRLDQLASLSLASSFDQPETRKYAVTALARNLATFFSELETALSKGEAPRRKMVLAVGHDVNLFLLMLSLEKSSYSCLLAIAEGKKTDKDCAVLPPPGSSFIFEVREDAKGKHQVKFLINGKQQSFCSASPDAPCDLSSFKAQLEGLGAVGKMEDLLQRYCRRPPVNQNNYLIGLIFFNLVLLAFLIFTLRRLYSK